MNVQAEYTGTHKVILPPDYMNSVEAVCDLHEEAIADAALSLDIPGLRTTRKRRVLRISLVALAVWLAPAFWLTCL